MLMMKDVASRAKRLFVSGGIGLALTALAACGNGGGAADDVELAGTPTPSPTATEQSVQPALNAADAMRLARAALLSPDSPLLDNYETTIDELSTNRAEFAPLYDCMQEETVDSRIASYSQRFEGPWPRISVSAHAYEVPAVEVLEQLRETWDSECTTFEENDTPEPYRSERIAPVAPPDGVDPEQWAADCAEATILEDDTGGIVFCSALVVVGEHIILDVELSGLLPEREQYAELLGAIATEVLAAQE
jgi:hypothetical protein